MLLLNKCDIYIENIKVIKKIIKVSTVKKKTIYY